jgi:hypothetical protein
MGPDRENHVGYRRGSTVGGVKGNLSVYRLDVDRHGGAFA